MGQRETFSRITIKQFFSMKNIFNSVMFNKPARSRFNLGHDVKLSFQMGELIPTCALEVIPGDDISISVENMLRFAPLISPMMHKVNVTTHYFFVPNRILWSEWEGFITGENDAASAPYMNYDVCEIGSLCDYMGIPTGEFALTQAASVLPIAAYVKIWDEYYRDQNLQTPKFETVISGGGGSHLYTPWLVDGPLRRAWMHDYFTSALPFAQKGDAVQIPLTSQDDIPVELIAPGAGTPHQLVTHKVTGAPIVAGDLTSDNSGQLGVGGPPSTTAVAIDPNGTLTVDVQAGATDINTLRRAFRLQEWLEKNARGGTRYVENILAHFGVKSDDARMQRPEYIGGAKQNMVISEVLATAENTEANVNVGQMAGHGISVGSGRRFNYRAKEHGWIIGIINVQPVTAYQQGLHKKFTRFDRLDYAWPTFANIGEQEVLNKEVYADHATPNGVFGYVPRYAEYKYENSRVAGEMRDTLAYWHLGRIFETPPALNSAFIECVPDTRVFAVTEESADHIYAHVFNNITVNRALPRYGIPTI